MRVIFENRLAQQVAERPAGDGHSALGVAEVIVMLTYLSVVSQAVVGRTCFACPYFEGCDGGGRSQNII